MTKSLRNTAEVFIFALAVAAAGILATHAKYGAEVLNGVKLWAAVVLPSLFPYFFITAVLSSLSITGKLAARLSPLSKRLFNTGGVAAYAFFISVVSGYPVGAKIVSDMKTRGLLTESESVRAAALCSTSSPMFLMGSVGNVMFNDSVFGVALFVCHLLSAVMTGIVFSLYKRKEKPLDDAYFTPETTDNLLYESVYSAVNSILFVGGLITIFYLFTEILYSLGALTPLIRLFTAAFGNENTAKGVVLGLFECTKGLKAMSVCGINFLTLPLAAAICGFGGLSVICQSLAYLKKAKIKAAPFLAAKTAAAIFNFIFGTLFSLILF